MSFVPVMQAATCGIAARRPSRRGAIGRGIGASCSSDRNAHEVNPSQPRPEPRGIRWRYTIPPGVFSKKSGTKVALYHGAELVRMKTVGAGDKCAMAVSDFRWSRRCLPARCVGLVRLAEKPNLASYKVRYQTSF